MALRRLIFCFATTFCLSGAADITTKCHESLGSQMVALENWLSDKLEVGAPKACQHKELQQFLMDFGTAKLECDREGIDTEYVFPNYEYKAWNMMCPKPKPASHGTTPARQREDSKEKTPAKPTEDGREERPLVKPTEDGREERIPVKPTEDSREDRASVKPTDDINEETIFSKPTKDGREERPPAKPTEGGREERPPVKPTEDGREERPPVKPTEDSGEDRASVKPADDINEETIFSKPAEDARDETRKTQKGTRKGTKDGQDQSQEERREKENTRLSPDFGETCTKKLDSTAHRIRKWLAKRTALEAPEACRREELDQLVNDFNMAKSQCGMKDPNAHALFPYKQYEMWKEKCPQQTAPQVPAGDGEDGTGEERKEEEADESDEHDREEL